MLLPKDPNDEKNVILEIRAGTGGDEASLFVAEVFRMYSRFAEQHRWKVEVLSQSESGVGGLKEVIAIIEGQRVFSSMRIWPGCSAATAARITSTTCGPSLTPSPTSCCSTRTRSAGSLSPSTTAMRPSGWA